MAIVLPDAREVSDEVLEALRRRALRGCKLGRAAVEVAQLLGVARETVGRGWSAYAEPGGSARPPRRSGRPVGSGRLLTDAPAEHRQGRRRTHQPEDVGMAAPGGTRRAVCDGIRKEYPRDLAERTVGRYRRRWGVPAKRPRRHAGDPDPEELRQGWAEPDPAMAARAEPEGAEIPWGDEVGVAADPPPALGSAPRGEPALADVPDPPVRARPISTITHRGEVRLMTDPQTMTAARLVVFWGRLLRSTTGKVFRIVDWLRAHRTLAVPAWVAAHHPFQHGPDRHKLVSWLRL